MAVEVVSSGLGSRQPSNRKSLDEARCQGTRRHVFAVGRSRGSHRKGAGRRRPEALQVNGPVQRGRHAHYVQGAFGRPGCVWARAGWLVTSCLGSRSATPRPPRALYAQQAARGYGPSLRTPRRPHQGWVPRLWRSGSQPSTPAAARAPAATLPGAPPGPGRARRTVGDSRRPPAAPHWLACAARPSLSFPPCTGPLLRGAFQQAGRAEGRQGVPAGKGHRLQCVRPAPPGAARRPA